MVMINKKKRINKLKKRIRKGALKVSCVSGSKNIIVKFKKWEEVKSLILESEKTIVDLENNLKNILQDISKIEQEIINEIKHRPQYSNIGKRGCVRRLRNIIDKYTSK